MMTAIGQACGGPFVHGGRAWAGSSGGGQVLEAVDADVVVECA